MGKPSYEKPTSQVDLEARLDKDYKSPSILNVGEFTDKPSENGYIATDPIYQSFANETEKPYAAEKGVEKKLEEGLYSDDVDFDAGATPEGQGDAETEEDKAETGQSASGVKTTPDGGSTPPVATSPPNPNPGS